MKTPAEIANEIVNSINKDGSIKFAGLARVPNEDELTRAIVARAIEADRAQVTVLLRECIRLHNDDASNPEYLRGQVEMAAYIIGYSDPGEGDALREDLTTEAGK